MNRDSINGDNTEECERLRAPFPWFGGKSCCASLIWERFGDVANYIEPFAGSLAVLLARPTAPHTETVNDIDCYLANFWRATTLASEEVARWCDSPVNEADLHARHRWLHKQADFREKLRHDPEFYDAKIAGWWVWGLSAWIGDNWCRVNEQNSLPNMGGGTGPHCEEFAEDVPSKRPNISGWGDDSPRNGKGVIAINMADKVPQLSGGGGRGLNQTKLADVEEKRPVATYGGRGIHAVTLNDVEQQPTKLLAYFRQLQARLRRVRVCCGDWQRVCTPAVTIRNGLTGVLLDPPYGTDTRDKVYNHDSLTVAGDVCKWALENGANPLLRIALCGYEEEHSPHMPPTWECVAWKTNGGYGNTRKDKSNQNRHRERIWFSPHCLRPGGMLFE